MELAEWINSYGKAWETADEDLLSNGGRPMIDDGEEVTLPGCLLLRFAPDGRCADLREYWNVERGRRDPFMGWGT